MKAQLNPPNKAQVNPELIPVSRVFDVYDLKAQFSGLSHWFDADSMRF